MTNEDVDALAKTITPERSLEELRGYLEMGFRTELWARRLQGLALIAIKDKLGHGEFGDWIERKYHLTQRTVARRMTIAREWDRVFAEDSTVKNQGQFFDVLERAAGKSTPAQEKNEPRPNWTNLSNLDGAARTTEEGSSSTPREELLAAAQSVVVAARTPGHPRRPPVSAAVDPAQPKVVRTVPYDLAQRALEAEKGVTYLGPIHDKEMEQDIAHVRRLAQTIAKADGKNHEEAAKEAAHFVAGVRPSIENSKESGRNSILSSSIYIAPPIRDAVRLMRQAVNEAEKTYCSPEHAGVIGLDLCELEQLVSRVRSLISAPRVSLGKPRLVAPPASLDDAPQTNE